MLIDKDIISSEQAKQLKQKVAEKCRTRKEIMKIWSSFKSTFHVSRYSLLQRKHFQKALKWLEIY